MSTVILEEGTIFKNIRMVPDEEFASIRMRGITNAFPVVMLDNGGYPNRQLMFWPIPSSAQQCVELWLWQPLQIYGLDDELDLPPGYERYLVYALAVELADIMGKKITRDIAESLHEAENNIKTLNAVDFVSEPSGALLALSSRGRAYNYIDFISGANMLPDRVT